MALSGSVVPRGVNLAAMALGAVPLLWMAARQQAGHWLDMSWWWMAFGFGVSWVADTIVPFFSLLPPYPAVQKTALFVSQLYLPTQAACFVLVLAPRRPWWMKQALIGGLLCATTSSIAWRLMEGPDLWASVISWSLVAILALRTTGWLRTALVVGFAGQAVAWCLFATAKGYDRWLDYQLIRAVGVSLWCVAAWQASRRVGSLSTRYT